MDSNNTVDAVKRVIEKYALLRPSHGDIELQVVFDDENGRYALMQTGWDKNRRVRGNLIYITVEKDTVQIEYDGIEHGVIEDLENEGIPESKIVLAYLDQQELLMTA